MGTGYDFGRAGEVRLANGGRVPLRIATADGFPGKIPRPHGDAFLDGGCGLLLQGMHVDSHVLHALRDRRDLDRRDECAGVAEVLRVDSEVRPWRVALGPEGREVLRRGRIRLDPRGTGRRVHTRLKAGRRRRVAELFLVERRQGERQRRCPRKTRRSRTRCAKDEKRRGIPFSRRAVFAGLGLACCPAP